MPSRRLVLQRKIESEVADLRENIRLVKHLNALPKPGQLFHPIFEALSHPYNANPKEC